MTPTWRAAISLILALAWTALSSGCDEGDAREHDATRGIADTPPADQARTASSSAPALDTCRNPESAAAIEFARALIDRVNAARANGADCGNFGHFAPARALATSPQLSCAARLQSVDMALRGFFDHRNPDGHDSTERARRAGFTRPVAENLAWGQATADAVVASWVHSAGHCKNMLDPRWSMTGVGYYVSAGGRTLWTQLYGRE